MLMLMHGGLAARLECLEMHTYSIQDIGQVAGIVGGWFEEYYFVCFSEEVIVFGNEMGYVVLCAYGIPMYSEIMW